jgi:hypothetical protein
MGTVAQNLGDIPHYQIVGRPLEPLLVDIATFSTRYESKRVFKVGRPRMTIKQIFRTDRLSEIYDY